MVLRSLGLRRCKGSSAKLAHQPRARVGPFQSLLLKSGVFGGGLLALVVRRPAGSSAAGGALVLGLRGGGPDPPPLDCNLFHSGETATSPSITSSDSPNITTRLGGSWSPGALAMNESNERSP